MFWPTGAASSRRASERLRIRRRDEIITAITATLGVAGFWSAVYWAHLAAAVGATADIERSVAALELSVEGSPPPDVFELQAGTLSETHALLLALLERRAVDWGVRVDDDDDRVWVYLASEELLELHRDRIATSGSANAGRMIYLMPSALAAPERRDGRDPVAAKAPSSPGLAEVTPIEEARHIRELNAASTTGDPAPGKGRRFWDAVQSDMQNEVAAGLLTAEPRAN